MVMKTLAEYAEIIKTLKQARDILQGEYEQTDFHKKKEMHPHSTVPSLPQDEEVYKLLTAIQQLDHYIKKFQDEQFQLIKQQDNQ